jgi:hypothetical protein
VHGGHDSSFGRERMIGIVDRYLASTSERRTGTD